MEAEIEVQIEGEEPSTIPELCLDKWRGSEISPRDKVILERFKNLNYLSFVGCGLKSLVNFPNLPNLVKLDLSENQIKGGFEHFPRFEELMEITLAGNLIESPEALRPLTRQPSLVSLDLFGCPVNDVESYREKVFEMFPDLNILDGLDADGEEAYLDDSVEEEEGLSDEDSEALEAFLNGEMDSDEEEESELEEEVDVRRQKRPRYFGEDQGPSKHNKKK